MIIELKEHGHIVLDQAAQLPVGDVEIILTYTTEAVRKDEALWDAQFAATPPEAFQRLIEEALTEIRNRDVEGY
ncbi:MAG: hypothetical protein ACOYL5_03280 [Phototrophicaceae bacterium]|jgi:hypothetical protein